MRNDITTRWNEPLKQTERKQWIARVEFYGKKLQKFTDKFPGRKYPSHSTVQRWQREFNSKGAENERI